MKSWYLSKTIWFNLLTAIVAIVGELTNTITMNADTANIFGMVITVGNVLLRLITTEQISK